MACPSGLQVMPGHLQWSEAAVAFIPLMEDHQVELRRASASASASAWLALLPAGAAAAARGTETESLLLYDNNENKIIETTHSRLGLLPLPQPHPIVLLLRSSWMLQLIGALSYTSQINHFPLLLSLPLSFCGTWKKLPFFFFFSWIFK